MHVDFDPFKVEWSALTQISPEVVVQYGGYNVFRGVPYQRGSGIGSVFRSLLRYLIPIGKEIGTAIGRQGLESGNRVLSNVLEGRDLKESLVSEGKTGLKNLLEKAANNINAQKGQGFDFKRYTKRNDAREGGAIGKAKKGINKLQSRLGPHDFLPANTPAGRKKKHTKQKSVKRLRTDILGTY